MDVRLFVYRGITRMYLKQYEQAITDFDIALRNYEKIPEAYYHKALALEKLGKTNAACKNLGKAMSIALQGYIYKDAYKDVIDQLYLSDIEQAQDSLCRATEKNN